MNKNSEICYGDPGHPPHHPSYPLSLIRTPNLNRADNNFSEKLTRAGIYGYQLNI